MWQRAISTVGGGGGGNWKTAPSTSMAINGTKTVNLGEPFEECVVGVFYNNRYTAMASHLNGVNDMVTGYNVTFNGASGTVTFSASDTVVTRQDYYYR